MSRDLVRACAIGRAATLRRGPGPAGVRADGLFSPAGWDTPTWAQATCSGRVPTCRANACGGRPAATSVSRPASAHGLRKSGLTGSPAVHGQADRSEATMLGTDTMLGPDAVVGTDLGVVLRTAAVSSAGPGPANQDSACAGPHLVAIADGVGGAVGGATASSLVIDWLIRQRRRPGATAAGGLSRAIAGANQRLGLACVRWPDLRTMA